MKTLNMPTASVLLLSVLGLSCQPLGGKLGQAVCPQMGPGADALNAAYTQDARLNGKVATFVHASKDLIELSGHVEAEIADTCRKIGADLGMSPAEMAPQKGPGGAASGACHAVGARIDAIFQQGARVSVQVQPPSCEVNADAEARCKGACSAQVDPGQIVAQCEPARLRGFCQGRCIGRCDGRCQGTCQGQCSAVDAQGRCAGTCQGTCDGACDATCHAQCQGTWQAPKCEGSVTPPSADAECDASCRAHAEFRAACTPAQVQVQASQNTEAAMRLAASLQQHLPRLVYAEIALAKRLAGSIQVMGQVGAQLPNIVGRAGAHAIACVGAAAEASASASARIDVSVQASASVTGRVGARAQ